MKDTEKAHKKALSRKIAIVGLAATGGEFWLAQLIVWGLSLYHVHSGIWGPWLILEALTTAGVTVVAIGMMRAVYYFPRL
jgi:hypothetical protein